MAALVHGPGRTRGGVQPDFICSAKAITNAYFPFGATMISDAVGEVFESDATGKAVAYKEGAMVRVSGKNIIMSPPLVVTSADVARY